MSKKMRANHETTIGIVTALAEESGPMREQIDNRHELERTHRDSVTYCTGRIGPHHVVLIQLPQAGNGIAVRECTTLLGNFPNIRLLLMVGTAAGANVDDTRPAIALGDVIVSTRGVVEYDHIDRFPDADRQRGPLRTPSGILRRHVESVQGDAAHGRRWRRLIADAQGRHPGKFDRPDGDTASSAVHLGKIASGNTAFSHQRAVAAVAKKHEAIAVDMETAGVAEAAADGCGWMAIRGVSDYGEEFRTKRWRDYASLATAAYTRALLEELKPFPSPEPARRRRVWPWAVGALTVVAALVITDFVLRNRPVHLADQVTVANGTQLSTRQTATLTITDPGSWRQYLDLTIVLENRRQVGDCTNPAQLHLVVITDGHTRHKVPLARSNEPVTVDIGGVQRTVLVEVTVDIPDESCHVDLSVADAVLHN
jgi:nucleoside phosphorylase